MAIVEHHRRDGAKTVLELPASKHPWDIAWHTVDDQVVGCWAANPDFSLRYVDFATGAITELALEVKIP